MGPPAASASAGDTVHAPGTGQAVDVSKAQLPAVLPAGLHVLFMIVESEPALKTIDISCTAFQNAVKGYRCTVRLGHAALGRTGMRDELQSLTVFSISVCFTMIPSDANECRTIPFVCVVVCRRQMNLRSSA